MTVNSFLGTRLKYYLAGFLVLVFSLTWVLQGQAHAFLERSDPADNSVLEESPAEIRLWFSEEIVPGFSTAQILDQDGNLHLINTTQPDAQDPGVLVLNPAKLDAGVYTVNWKVISAADGHISSGYFVFRIGSATQQENPAAGAALVQQAGWQSAETRLEIVLRWLNYLGLIILGGVAGILTLVRPTKRVELERVYVQAQRRMLRLGMYTAALLLLIGLFFVIAQIYNLSLNTMSGKVEDLSTVQWISQILFATNWGYAWLARQLLLIGLLASYLVLSGTDRLGLFALALIDLQTLGALLAQALSSHAAALPAPALPVTVDFLHLVFAGLWIGGLIALVVGFLPLIKWDKKSFTQIAPLVWGLFSWIALISVVMLVATGLFSTGSQVVSADALALTPYGKTLAVKIILMLSVGLIGLTNSMLLHPKLASPIARIMRKPTGWTPIKLPHFPRLLLVEISLGALVVLFAGILTSIPPAKNPQYTIAAKDQIDQVIQPANDLWVKLSIKPNQPGLNVVNIGVLNSRRPAPAETLRLILRFTYLEQDFGTFTKDADFIGQDKFEDLYRLNGSFLNQPGRWEIETVVRRKGLPDSTVTNFWTVMPLGGYQPPVISRYPWKDMLTISAIIVLVILLLVLFALRKRPSQMASNQPLDKPGA